jgi:hypothetical protein
MNAVGEILGESENPTDFLRRWDAFSGDMRVLGNLMAVLKRDCKTEALAALHQAILDPTFTFSGETIPLEKTVPATLVMFKPEATLLMLTWITQGNWQDLNSFLANEQTVYNQDRWPMIVDLFEKFPSLRRATEERKRRQDYEGWDLLYAYQVDVLRGFTIPQDFNPMYLGFGQYNDHLELCPPNQVFGKAVTLDPNVGEVECLAHFAFWVQADQAAVLSRFSREQQEQMATWQFHVHPDLLKGSPLPVDIGLHVESKHEALQLRYPSRTSAGLSRGFGGIIDPPHGYVNEWNAPQKDEFVFVTVEE